jgi:probable F420-dependent oxidoreductase
VKLGAVGIWSGELRFLRAREAAEEAAAELEELGFETLWIPGGTGTGKPVFDIAEGLLRATDAAIVATGIVSIWVVGAPEAAEGQKRLHAAYPGRFLLGLGTSHTQFVDEATRPLLARPRAAMVEYLDALDHSTPAELHGERVLAALRPRMLELAQERTLGAHPYLITPSHTAQAREILGPDSLLAPEQAVVLETDPTRAREVARGHLAAYVGLPNYTENLLRYGFTEQDFEDGGSDRLVDALVAWGDEAAIAARVAEHRAAGADHVALQVLSGRRGELPSAEWRRLAQALL